MDFHTPDVNVFNRCLFSKSDLQKSVAKGDIFWKVFKHPSLKICSSFLNFAPPGQFSREPEVNVYDIHDGADPLKKEATMEVKGNRLHVTRYVPTETSPVLL